MSRSLSATGTVEWGHEVAIGYFAQDHRASIQPGAKADSRMAAAGGSDGERQGELRGLLGQMLFARDEAMKPTQALSGGEAARLLFCRMMLHKPNVLVLDEPSKPLWIWNRSTRSISRCRSSRARCSW